MAGKWFPSSILSIFTQRVPTGGVPYATPTGSRYWTVLIGGTIGTWVGKYVPSEMSRFPQNVAYFRPPASFDAPGSPLRRSIESVPIAGPSANGANAHCQPTWSTTTGISWIEIVVRRKPIAV